MEKKGTFTTREEGVLFVEEALHEMKIAKPYSAMASINAEHAIFHVMKAFHGHDKKYTITVKKSIFFTDISVEACGNRVDFDDGVICRNSEMDDDVFSNRSHEMFQYRRTHGINRISFAVVESDAKELIVTLLAMALGIVAGLLIKFFCSQSIQEGINYYLLNLIEGVFMNALKIIVGPVVFFSLVCCVSKYKNLSELGRYGVKTIAMYLFTTIVAITVGFSLYKAFPVGNPSIVRYVEVQGDEEAKEEFEEVQENMETADFSIRNTISNIVPDNFIRPFLEVSLLQIIFLGILVGIGIGRSGNDADFLQNMVMAINHLLTVITSIITKFIPVAVFCAMAGLVIDIGVEALGSILSFAVLVILGMLCMVVFYCILILVVARLNPFIFLKKFSKAMMTAFATSSATVTMPTSMRCCEEMGIDSRIAGFTIPLGANINMDGSSVVFILAVMFMCKIYGIELTGSALIATMVSIVFLALGSPSVAGADLVIIAVLLKQVGVPMEAIGLILGVDAFFDMIQAVSNTTGDAVVTLVVAKSEGMLDEDKYKC